MAFETGGKSARRERSLIREGMEGNRDALESLFGSHARTTYLAAFKLLGNAEDAEDALQEGFLSAYRNLSRFEGRSQFGTWLTRIVINAALMQLRRSRAYEMFSIEDEPEDDGLTWADRLADPYPDPEELYTRHELQALLEEKSSRLSPLARAALRLRYLEGFTIEEAAEVLGVCENTMKSVLHRARTRLRTSFRRTQARRFSPPVTAGAAQTSI